MRKLLSGYLFRMIKDPVICILLVLSVIASVYITSIIFEELSPVTVLHTDKHLYLGNYNQVYVDAGNAKEYRFESMGVSALDIAQCGVVPIDQDDFDLITYGVQTGSYESWMFNGFLVSLHYASAVLIALVIPVFFGRLFSDGTIKNLVACGYSKRKIYLSALICSFLMDMLMILLNIFVFICFCIYYEWKPPIYLPSSFTALLVEVLIVFNVSAFVVSALFASFRKTATFVAGFLMLAFVFWGSNPLVEFFQEHTVDLNTQTEYAEYSRIAKEYGYNSFESKMDLSTLSSEVYFGDRKIMSANESTLPAALRNTIVTLIYLDPALTVRGELGYGFNNYIFYRNGVSFIELAANVLWIAASTGVGITLFRKRELH